MARLQRRFLLVAAGSVVIVALAAAAALLLVGSHLAPTELSLHSAQPSGTASSIAGAWKVGAGSQVGYRAREKFINQPAETEAVARTDHVNGSLSVALQGNVAKVTHMKFTVDLASLTSQDKYANYQAFQRDFFVRTIYLETKSFPTATFTADSLSFPLPAGGPATVDLGGKLNVHGVTQPVTAHIQAQSTGGGAEIAGSMTVDMRDFGIEPPDISFTRAEPQLTIEFDLNLVHA